MSEPAHVVGDVGTNYPRTWSEGSGTIGSNEGRLEVSAEIFGPSFAGRGHRVLRNGMVLRGGPRSSGRYGRCYPI
jgi:hypothetical protein